MTRSTLQNRFKTSVFAIALALPVAMPLAVQAEPQQGGVRIRPMGGSYLGIEMENVTAENMASYKLNAEAGVIVRSVEKGSPAETANLQEKDVILQYAGMPVFCTMQLEILVLETLGGRGIDLEIG